MLKKRWTKKEIRSLKKQFKSGININEINIKDRTRLSIKYKLHSLRLLTRKWSCKEINNVKKLIKSGLSIKEINIPKRSHHSIRNKSIRLGLWKTKKRNIRPWTIIEIKKMKDLIFNYSYRAIDIHKIGNFGRTFFSIAKQVNRIKTGKI